MKQRTLLMHMLNIVKLQYDNQVGLHIIINELLAAVPVYTNCICASASFDKKIALWLSCYRRRVICVYYTPYHTSHIYEHLVNCNEWEWMNMYYLLPPCRARRLYPSNVYKSSLFDWSVVVKTWSYVQVTLAIKQNRKFIILLLKLIFFLLSNVHNNVWVQLTF